MRRYAPLCLLIALVAGCEELANVPPPPVSLTVLEGHAQEGSAGADELLGSSQHDVRLMEAIPSDALFTLHLPDIGTATQRFKDTGLYQWFTSKEVKEQLGDNAQFWAKIDIPQMGSPGGQGGVDVRRLMNSLKGEFVLALEDIRPESPGPIPEIRALAGITVTGAEHEAEQLLQLVDMLAAAQDGVHVEKGTVAGYAYSRIVGKNPMPWVVELALYHDALFAGFGRETVTDALDRLEDQDKLSLADEPAFRDAMKRCGDPRDVVRIHLALEEVNKRYGSLLPAEASRVIRALGLHHLRSAIAAVRLEGVNIAVSTLLDSPGGKDCFTQLLATHTADRQFLTRLPADTASFSIFAVDGNKIIQTLRSALPETMRAEFEDALTGLRKSDVDLETDVFDLFGPRCALVNVPTDRLDDGPGLEAIWNHLLGTAFICEVQDPARAKEVLARLPEQTAMTQRRQVNIEGVVADCYTFQSSELPPDFALCYVVDEGYLVIAPTERTLRRMLRHRSPETAKRFRKLLEGVPDEAVVVSYDDLRQGPGIYLDAMVKGMAAGVGGTPPPGTRRRVRRQSGLAQLGPQISYTVADKQGIFSFTRSPTGGFGSIGGLSGLAMIAAIAVPNLHQARVNANEASATATLHAIFTAQESYRANNLRDEDGDGDGEYGFLAELLGQQRPGEKRVRSPNPLVSGNFLQEGGDFTRNGYYFRVYLPAEDGSPIGEHEGEARIAEVDGDLAETVMVVVAWPVSRGLSGHRAFYLDASGRVFACPNGSYSKKTPPSPDVLSSQERNLASKMIREGTPARDGHRWMRVR